MSKDSPAKYEDIRVANATLDAAEDRIKQLEKELRSATGAPPKAARPRVTCSHCNGTGRVELANEQMATFSLFTRGVEICGIDVALRLNIAHTAACNRLVDLARHELLTVIRREGRKVYYRRSAA